MPWSSRLGQPYADHLPLGAAFLVALGMALFLPVERYVPACHREPSLSMPGPLRPEYIGKLRERFEVLDMWYVARGGALYLPAAQPSNPFSWFPQWSGDLYNSESKAAAAVASMRGGSDGKSAAPGVLLRLIADTEPIHGPYWRDSAPTEPALGAGIRFSTDCELFQAAAVAIEDPRAVRLEYVPFEERRPFCSPLNYRLWRQYCGRVYRVHPDGRRFRILQ